MKTTGPGTALRGGRVALHHFADGRLGSIIRNARSPSRFTAPIRFPTQPRMRKPWTCGSMRSSRHNQRWPRPRDGPSHRLAITAPCCAHFREGPVLAILAMLALKDALCVAPGGSAPLFPFRSAPWPPMFQAGTGKRRLNRTRKPARHDRSHALTTQKGTSWRCGNRGHFGVALTYSDSLGFQRFEDGGASTHSSRNVCGPLLRSLAVSPRCRYSPSRWPSVVIPPPISVIASPSATR